MSFRFAWVAAVAGVALASSCVSTEPAVNTGPDCTFANGMWNCTEGRGPFTDCATIGGAGPLGAPCDYNGGCFSCSLDNIAGVACSCVPGDGGRVWQCVGSGTSCHDPRRGP